MPKLSFQEGKKTAAGNHGNIGKPTGEFSESRPLCNRVKSLHGKCCCSNILILQTPCGDRKEKEILFCSFPCRGLTTRKFVEQSSTRHTTTQARMTCSVPSFGSKLHLKISLRTSASAWACSLYLGTPGVAEWRFPSLALHCSSLPKPLDPPSHFRRLSPPSQPPHAWWTRPHMLAHGQRNLRQPAQSGPK